ncbi:Protein F42A8.3, partial [Aphelenchoides avenae]
MLALWITALFTACEAATATWDLDAPCQEHIQKFAETQAKMVKCATSWSSPPKVCTNCFDQYIEFKQMEYFTHHLDNVTSLDNTTCTKVIYANYLLSYVYEISNALTKRVWDTSRCDDCLVINWDFEHGNSTIEYDEKTIRFQALLYEWRDCVSNYSDANANASTICDRCGQSFDDLFDYYWKIYTNPSTEFCVDVETTMNDTMNLWHNVWRCPDDGRSRDRHHDATVVAFAATILVIVIGLFYAGSYVQTEHAERNLIRYSRMEAPRGGPRSRLLSSSTVDSPLSGYTATTTTS